MENRKQLERSATMIQIVCEVCGSKEIKKQGDTFVCQSCGIQYSLDSVKNMLNNAQYKKESNYTNALLLTTKDIVIGHNSKRSYNPFDITNTLTVAEVASDQSAILIYGDKQFMCDKYTYYQERKRSSDGTKWIYETKPIEELEDWMFSPYVNDGKNALGFHGYEYNVLDCFVQFLEDLPSGSSLTAVPEGESSMDELIISMDISKPEWLSRGKVRPNNYLDRRKCEFKKQIDNICAQNNLFIDLTPHYYEIKSVKLLSEDILEHTRRFEGDTYYTVQKWYKMESADGTVSKVSYEQLMSAIEKCNKYNIPVCTIDE